jgi:hypothetical protein
MVQNSTIVNNSAIGLHADGGSAALRVTQTTITGNGTGVAATNGGTLESFGDNALRGNTTDSAPSSVIGLK